MDFRNHPQYAPIEKHIRAAGVERTVVIAEAIGGFVVDCWNALLLPPAPSAVLIDRRRESRSDTIRTVTRLAHR
jgi:hypothetical protein